MNTCPGDLSLTVGLSSCLGFDGQPGGMHRSLRMQRVCLAFTGQDFQTELGKKKDHLHAHFRRQFRGQLIVGAFVVLGVKVSFCLLCVTLSQAHWHPGMGWVPPSGLRSCRGTFRNTLPLISKRPMLSDFAMISFWGVSQEGSGTVQCPDVCVSADCRQEAHKLLILCPKMALFGLKIPVRVMWVTFWAFFPKRHRNFSLAAPNGGLMMGTQSLC